MKPRMFFHNDGSTESEIALKALEGEWEVFNACGEGRYKIPPEYHISRFPSRVDKELELSSSLPTKTGDFEIVFKCLDHTGKQVDDSKTYFYVFANEIMITHAIPENGILTVKLGASLPGEYRIRVDGEEYHPMLLRLSIGEEEAW